jgi:ABC-2 type transport system ATP-binding protein
VNAVSVEHVTRRFGEWAAVDDVSFETPAGQVLALLGPNGAGKTTTFEMLEGYLAPSAGSVRVLGVDPRRGDRAWRARIGLVLQSTSLDAQISVRDAISVFAALYPSPRSVAEVIELVDLEHEADSKIGQLSGGQQRRVDLALGIVGRPDLLFLDEPTTGLDPAARRQTWQLIEQLAGEGTTVLLSTHYMEEAQRLADRVLVLDQGRLVADASPACLRASALRSRLRLTLPAGAATEDLPPDLAGGLDARRGELVLHTGDIADTLEQLLGWSRTHGIDLSGLEVGPPSLEDTYLALTAPRDSGTPSHV